MEQGLGLGSGMPFFNRCTGSATRFIKLRNAPETSRSPPLTLVVHARAGTAVGDMASYDYFTLGGPFSVRCPLALSKAFDFHSVGQQTTEECCECSAHLHPYAS